MASVTFVDVPQTTEMHRFTSGKSTVGLPRDGVLLGEGPKDKLRLAVGDQVVVTDAQKGIPIDESVAGVVDEPMSPVVRRGGYYHQGHKSWHRGPLIAPHAANVLSPSARYTG